MSSGKTGVLVAVSLVCVFLLGANLNLNSMQAAPAAGGKGGSVNGVAGSAQRARQAITLLSARVHALDRAVSDAANTVQKKAETLASAAGANPVADAVAKPPRVVVQKVKRPVAAKANADGHAASAAANGGGKDAADLYHLRGGKFTQPPHWDQSIFVSIASFRDDECGGMVKDIYAKAKIPERLYLGIVEQNLKEDPPCVHGDFTQCQLNKFCPTDNIRSRLIGPKEAKGPTYARYLASLLYRGEKYFMMIDSHNRFITHWDQVAVDMHTSLPTKKGVLSHYPEGWMKEDKNFKIDGRTTTTHLCRAKFVDQGFPRLDGVVVSAKEKPMRQPWASAGFLFTLGDVLKVCPFDPHLPFLFDGEEILYSVRMWTNGYDMFSPSKSILFHFYGREKAKKVWSEVPDWPQIMKRSGQRVQYYLGALHPGTTDRIIPVNTTEDHIIVEKDKYGLGTERSIEAYWEFAGANLSRRKYTKKWCEWGNFEEWLDKDAVKA